MCKPEMSVSVSVHVVTFNSSTVIRACLESVLAQTLPVSKIIVIDNASIDDTWGVLSSYEDICTLVRNDNNLGFAAAHNQAIRLSTGEWLLILNPDIVLDRNYLNLIISAAKELPQGGSFTGKLLRSSDPSQIDSLGLGIDRNRRARDLAEVPTMTQVDSPFEVFGVSGAAALFSRKMAQDISVDGQFFDESFFAYKEDVDVAWRARLLGWGAYCVPAAVGLHERGWKEGARRQIPLPIRRYSYINRYRMMYKNDHFPDLLRMGLSIFFYELSSFFYALIREPRLLVAWRGFFRDLRRLSAHRRTIQSRKVVTSRELRRFFR